MPEHEGQRIALENRLLNRMTELIVEHLGVSSEEAVQIASTAKRDMDAAIEGKREAAEKREELKTRLKEEMTKVLEAVDPRLSDDVYRPFVDKIEARLLSSFQSFTGRSKEQSDFISRNYPRVERNILSGFLYSIPNSVLQTPVSAISRDFLTDHMIGVFEGAKLKLLGPELIRLIHSFEVAFAVFVGLTRIGLKDESERAFEAVVSEFKGVNLRSKNVQSQRKLKKSMVAILHHSLSRLSEYQRDSVADQIIWLFNDFISAPEEEREEVYAQGEQRILISIFDPLGLKGEQASVN